jgi:fluoride exporter
MNGWIRILLLSIGGVLGVNARYFVALGVNQITRPPFPWATFSINTSGSFLVGFLYVLLDRFLPHPNYKIMILTGFMGGYTTFSTFAFESLSLWEQKARWTSVIYIVSSVAAGVTAVAIGVSLARGACSWLPSRLPAPSLAVLTPQHPTRSSPTATQSADGDERPTGT